MVGKIHSLETFGAVDGPGIRFVVFLQGCPLRCAYCHNPDTWHVNGGTEMSVAELIAEVKKYKNYFGKDGGVTVTGGEPLLQIDFVIVNPTAGAHCGPNCVGIAFHAKHR